MESILGLVIEKKLNNESEEIFSFFNQKTKFFALKVKRGHKHQHQVKNS